MRVWYGAAVSRLDSQGADHAVRRRKRARPMARYASPCARSTAVGRSAAASGWRRIIRSLKAAIAQVVGSANATRRIHAGSRSIGHQHPPTGAIVTMTIEPTGSTALRLRAAPAAMRPKAVPAKRIPVDGGRIGCGSGPYLDTHWYDPRSTRVTVRCQV